jgi:hypothetical protein
MKKRLFFALFVAALVFLPCSVSAQTAPGPSQLDIAAAEAEDARKKAGDFECPSYFPSDWDAAESLYADAGRNRTPAAYNAATNAFNSLFNLTVPLYAQAREDDIMATRANLISTGARGSFPDHFSSADKTALLSLDQYEKKDYYTARDSSTKALQMYQILANIYGASLAQEGILERNFSSYDPDNFESAGEMMSGALTAYDAGDYALALKNAEEAKTRYELVLSTGWTGYAEMRATLAAAERQAALDIKANIAVRDLFAEADIEYRMAEENINSWKDYEEAASRFINAEALFIIASTAASEKRRKSTEAIREAYMRIEESDDTARQAGIIPGGTR